MVAPVSSPREVGRVTVYAHASHRALAPVLEAVAVHVLGLVPTGATFRYTQGDGEWTEPVTKLAVRAHARDVASWPLNGTCQIAADLPDGVVTFEYQGSAVDQFANLRLEAACFEATMPASWLRSPQFEGWFTQLLVLVPFSSATAGLAFEAVSQATVNRVYECPGVSVLPGRFLRLELGPKVAEVGWYTALGPSAVDALGGMKGIAACLTVEALLVPLAAGVLVKARPEPIRGDGGEAFDAEVALAGLLHEAALLAVPTRTRSGTWVLDAPDDDLIEQQFRAQTTWLLRFTLRERLTHVRSLRQKPDLARPPVSDDEALF